MRTLDNWCTIYTVFTVSTSKSRRAHWLIISLIFSFPFLSFLYREILVVNVHVNHSMPLQEAEPANDDVSDDVSVEQSVDTRTSSAVSSNVAPLKFGNGRIFSDILPIMYSFSCIYN